MACFFRVSEHKRDLKYIFSFSFFAQIFRVNDTKSLVNQTIDNAYSYLPEKN